MYPFDVVKIEQKPMLWLPMLASANFALVVTGKIWKPFPPNVDTYDLSHWFATFFYCTVNFDAIG